MIIGMANTYIPQNAMRTVENRKDLDKGARIIDPANAIWDNAQAVGIVIWYLRNKSPSGTEHDDLLTTDELSSSDGSSTIQGKSIEPPKDIKENKTRANEPVLAISPTTSFDSFSSWAVFAF